MADRDAMIAKVKALWDRAEHPNTPEHEAAACREKAAEMMAKYEIEQFVLAEKSGGEAAIVLGLFRIDTFDNKGHSKMILSDERMLLAGAIARNFECKGVIKRMNASADRVTGKATEAGLFYECIGYAHDFEMVRELYFNLVVDMLAGVYSEAQTNRNYQVQYARGFVDRIDDRLVEFYRRVNDWVDNGEVSDSVSLAIRSRLQKVQDKFDEMYPPGTLGEAKIRSSSYDGNARARGADRAARSDIGGQKLGSSASKALGKDRKGLNV